MSFEEANRKQRELLFLLCDLYMREIEVITSMYNMRNLIVKRAIMYLSPPKRPIYRAIKFWGLRILDSQVLIFLIALGIVPYAFVMAVSHTTFIPVILSIIVIILGFFLLFFFIVRILPYIKENYNFNSKYLKESPDEHRHHINHLKRIINTINIYKQDDVLGLGYIEFMNLEIKRINKDLFGTEDVFSQTDKGLDLTKKIDAYYNTILSNQLSFIYDKEVKIDSFSIEKFKEATSPFQQDKKYAIKKSLFSVGIDD